MPKLVEHVWYHSIPNEIMNHQADFGRLADDFGLFMEYDDDMACLVTINRRIC